MALPLPVVIRGVALLDQQVPGDLLEDLAVVRRHVALPASQGLRFDRSQRFRILRKLGCVAIARLDLGVRQHAFVPRLLQKLQQFLDRRARLTHQALVAQRVHASIGQIWLDRQQAVPPARLAGHFTAERCKPADELRA